MASTLGRNKPGLTLLLLILCASVCLGCWSEPEAPAPLPIPVADPQIVPRPAPPLEAGDFAAVRQFRFFYDITITGLKPGEAARIWVPVAVDGAQQRVKREQTSIPGKVQETLEATHGNPLLYTEAAANEQGEIPLQVIYLVERVEAMPGAGEKVSTSLPEKSFEMLEGPGDIPGLEFWLSNRALPGEVPAAEQAKNFYEKLIRREESPWYDKIHVVRAFVNSCRVKKIPADVQWGFVIGQEPQGEVQALSLWARFATEGRWQMVDFEPAMKEGAMLQRSFGTLSPDRIHFATGYNFTLQPAPAESSQKYFALALPYAELKGQSYDSFLQHHLKTNFRYEDVTDADLK